MRQDLKDRGGKSALVVIDVQNDVVADGHDVDGVVSRIGKLLEHARNSDIPVIYVQHEDEWMAPGSEAWQIRAEIAPRDGEPVIAKRYPDSFAETDFAETLDRLGIGELVITGAQSDACVRATLYRALRDGYDVTLVSDAHTTSDREYNGTVIPAELVVAHVNAASPWVQYPNVTSTVVTHEDILAR
jgi:nicotinamidase-related amidase